MRWEDCEYGAPGIDCKRPYGNSDVEYDIAEILKWEIDEDGLTKKQCEEAYTIHCETLTALQIALAIGKFETGIYLNYEKYDTTKWRRIGDKLDIINNK